MSDEAPEKVCATLIQEMRSLHLSTVGPDEMPHASYTPYLYRAPCSFYIFVSQLAAHTRHVLANGKAAIMIIEDEQSAAQIFARTRVHYVCQAERIAPDHPEYLDLLDGYQDRHGNMVGMLRQLPDFVLFKLRPTSGQFVMGFGKAYKLTGEDVSIFEHARSG